MPSVEARVRQIVVWIEPISSAGRCLETTDDKLSNRHEEVRNPLIWQFDNWAVSQDPFLRNFSSRVKVQSRGGHSLSIPMSWLISCSKGAFEWLYGLPKFPEVILALLQEKHVHIKNYYPDYPNIQFKIHNIQKLLCSFIIPSQWTSFQLCMGDNFPTLHVLDLQI